MTRVVCANDYLYCVCILLEMYSRVPHNTHKRITIISRKRSHDDNAVIIKLLILEMQRPLIFVIFWEERDSI